MYVKKSMKEFEAHVSYLEVKIWLQEANRKSETEEKNKSLNCAETIDFDGKSFHFLGLIVRT